MYTPVHYLDTLFSSSKVDVENFTRKSYAQNLRVNASSEPTHSCIGTIYVPLGAVPLTAILIDFTQCRRYRSKAIAKMTGYSKYGFWSC